MNDLNNNSENMLDPNQSAPDQPETSAQTGDEFEREPVPQRSLLGFKSFIGMYAGEHCAGTELMLGPLFLASGASAFDLIVGLLIGNLLAVLSWMFMTAPIATRVRLTLSNLFFQISNRFIVFTPGHALRFENKLQF